MRTVLRFMACLGMTAVGGGTAIAQNQTPLVPAPGEFLSSIPYDTYLDFEETPPVAPVFDIREFGAVGDGKTVNTSALVKAIDAASEDGGTVLIAGGDFVSGTIQLKSNVTLRIAKDSVLRASRQSTDYGPLHFIYCENAKNIRIEGPGKIAGDGDAWWTEPRAVPPHTPPDIFDLAEANRLHGLAKRKKIPNRPSPFIRMHTSTDVVIRKVILENSPGWTVMVDHCDQVKIENIVLNNNYHGENTDGIDIVGSSDVEITHCFISTGDDGIVIKNGYAKELSRPMRDIRISGCAIRSSANAIKIGTETWSDISQIEITDCTVFCEEIWPWTLSGIAIESVDGARVSDITVKSITMNNVLCPIFIRLGNRNRWKDKDKAGSLERVQIDQVTATNVEFPCVISGIPGLYIKDVSMQNISMTYREAGEKLDIKQPVPELEDGYPEFWNFGDVPAYAVFARHVDGLTIRRFQVIPRNANVRNAYFEDDVLRLQRDTR